MIHSALRSAGRMDIFVDYYNVSFKHRRSGLVDVVDRIVSAVVPDYLDSDDKRVDLRLYGGWYEGRKPTRDAQHLSQSVTENYPSSIRSNSHFVIVNVELAYSKNATRLVIFGIRSDQGPRHAGSCFNRRSQPDVCCRIDARCTQVMISSFAASVPNRLVS